jgi:hypothetical protein
MSDIKPLPPGTWLRLKGLPAGITDEQLSELLRSRGLDVPPANVSVKDFGTYACAFVSITKEMLCEMVKAKVGNALRVEMCKRKAA